MSRKKSPGVGGTVEEFRRAHDPTFVTHDVSARFERKLNPGAKCFIVVAAQNATPVEPEWWETILTMVKHRKAELLVVALRYKNPTSQWTGSQQNEEYWVPEVQPYLWNVRRRLNPKLTLLGDFKIQPTAADPLTGAEALSLEQSGIIGHTKLHMRSIPTPASRMAKILTTTGACTVENYTDSRAGRIAAFHHSLSAVIVELDGKYFHLRHVHYDRKTKSATDLGTRYTPGGVEKALRPLALIMGDTHVRSIDPAVEAATFGKNGIVQTLHPWHLVWHDVLDAYSCNPHHLDDPFTKVAKWRGRGSNVKAEVMEAIQFIKDRTGNDACSVVVGSNHNDMLSRWIKRADWKTDPVNSEFYLETALLMHEGTKLTRKGTEYPDPFRLWVREANLSNVKVLEDDESFMLGGVELGMHGDRGPNGIRGSIRNLRRLGVKSVIGHSHTPGIDEGAYQTGTSTLLRLDYNRGPSSWLNCHCVLHADGKRQLIVIADGRWRSGKTTA